MLHISIYTRLRNFVIVFRVQRVRVENTSSRFFYKLSTETLKKMRAQRVRLDYLDFVTNWNFRHVLNLFRWARSSKLRASICEEIERRIFSTYTRWAHVSKVLRDLNLWNWENVSRHVLAEHAFCASIYEEIEMTYSLNIRASICEEIEMTYFFDVSWKVFSQHVLPNAYFSFQFVKISLRMLKARIC